LLSDLVGNAMALLASGVIAVTGWGLADRFAGAAIALWMIPRSWRVVRETLDVLMEGAPPGIDIDDVEDHLVALDSVVAVHDLHI